MLSADDIKLLCMAGESSRLDYKSEQYDIVSSDVDKNSRFVKDVLAFSNTSTLNNSTGYILIGVAEDERHLGVVKGLEKTLDPNLFRTLADGHTKRKVPFEVYSVEVDGRTVQVLEFPPQKKDPPHYATQKYGKIEANTVYYRVNASTTVARPEDIWQMGFSSASNDKPQLGVEVTPVTSILDDGLVHVFNLSCNIDPLYGKRSRDPLFGACSVLDNIGSSHWDVYQWYHRELAKIRCNVSLRNMSKTQADNLKVKVEVVDDLVGAKIEDVTDWGEVPRIGSISPCKSKSQQIQKIETLCPGESNGAIKVFGVSVAKSGKLSLRVNVYGANIDPIARDFCFEVRRHDLNLSIEAFETVTTNVRDMKSYRDFLANILVGLSDEPDGEGSGEYWEKLIYRFQHRQWESEYGEGLGK